MLVTYSQKFFFKAQNYFENVFIAILFEENVLLEVCCFRFVLTPVID